MPFLLQVQGPTYCPVSPDLLVERGAITINKVANVGIVFLRDEVCILGLAPAEGPLAQRFEN